MGSSSGGGVLHRLVEGGGKVEKSILRVLEVLEVVDGQQFIGWHYIHKAPGAFNPKLPLAQRRWHSGVFCRSNGFICALSSARV